MLGISLFAKDSTEFFIDFVKKAIENRLESNQKVKCSGSKINVLTFGNVLGCTVRVSICPLSC